MPAPTLDDQYWFNLSQKFVDAGQASRDAAALKLQNLTLWLWGIYTASATIGFALAAKPVSLGVKVLIAAASAGLIAIYWLTVWVQMPVSLEFDPRSPTEIRAAYAHGVVVKSRRLHTTLAFSVVAAVLVALALVISSIGKALPDLQAYGSVRDGKAAVAILAQVPPGAKGRYMVHGVADPKNAKKPVCEVTRSFRASSAGILQASVEVPPAASPLDVTIEWNETGGLTQALTRRVTLDQNPVSAGPVPGADAGKPSATGADAGKPAAPGGDAAKPPAPGADAAKPPATGADAAKPPAPRTGAVKPLATGPGAAKPPVSGPGAGNPPASAGSGTRVGQRLCYLAASLPIRQCCGWRRSRNR